MRVRVYSSRPHKMMMRLYLFVLCLLPFQHILGENNDVRPALTEKFVWKSIEFAWPSDADKQDAILNGYYIPQNNLPLVSLDVWGDKLFIAIPRYSIHIYNETIIKYYKFHNMK